MTNNETIKQTQDEGLDDEETIDEFIKKHLEQDSVSVSKEKASDPNNKATERLSPA